MTDVALIVADEEDLLLVRSADGGATWQAPDVVLAGVRPCCISQGPGGAIFVGTRGQGLWASDGGIRGWRRFPTPPRTDNVRAIDGTSAV